jgi:hypothetical protein
VKTQRLARFQQQRRESAPFECIERLSLAHPLQELEQVGLMQTQFQPGVFEGQPLDLQKTDQDIDQLAHRAGQQQGAARLDRERKCLTT